VALEWFNWIRMLYCGSFNRIYILGMVSMDERCSVLVREGAVERSQLGHPIHSIFLAIIK
jgi:hypothetical protein